MDAWDAEDVDRVFAGLAIHQERIKRALKEVEQPTPNSHANNRVRGSGK